MEESFVHLLVFGESYCHVTPENGVRTISRKQFEDIIEDENAVVSESSKSFSEIKEEFEKYYGKEHSQIRRRIQC